MKKTKFYPQCPCCKSSEKVNKRGFFIRKSDSKKIQMYKCFSCNKSFSDQTFSFDYYLKKRYLNQKIFRLLCKGASQRAIAFILEIKAEAIALRIKKFGELAKKYLAKTRTSEDLSEVQFDEMESFEHTKCKPVTMPIAVNPKNRKILALRVGKIAAKGLLAEISRKKYGPRKCQRKEKITEMLTEIKDSTELNTIFVTDQSPHYPKLIKKIIPEAKHIQFKGIRGCVVGQGELKASERDPLFSLNHTYAMIRDNIKRLTRRTWCTTKKIESLENILYIYSYFHNQVIDKIRPSIKNMPTC